jgi:hypothetical protein
MTIFVIQSRLNLKVLNVSFGESEDVDVSKDSTEPPLVLDVSPSVCLLLNNCNIDQRKKESNHK